MTSYRDLAEAAAFERRRLVAALVSGDANGSDPGPPQATRCVVGGLVLMLFCFGVVAAVHGTSGHPTIRWDDGVVRLAW